MEFSVGSLDYQIAVAKTHNVKQGRRFTAGRKGGEAWVTEAMRERASAEAHRTFALLKSANGDPAARARAKAMLDAQEHATGERDREQALAIVNRMRAETTARRPDALQSL
jgi:hypothetical protein